eukprot:TRINITY_DN3392_c0_g1_i1.p2 TRINITY_DN3392_c0_g1~~TRINITY_DN3392_c0_g1_i1.p2  ORF type:complete len:1163 (-),score=216.84 TRINITY_DN3392_c0_g1_i1:130-3618(-)
MADGVLLEGAVLNRMLRDGEGWQPYHGRLFDGGKFELLEKASSSSALDSFSIGKGTDMDLMPTKNGRFIIFLKLGKSFTEFALETEEQSAEWQMNIRMVLATMKKGGTLPFGLRKKTTNSASRERRASMSSVDKDKGRKGMMNKAWRKSAKGFGKTLSRKTPPSSPDHSSDRSDSVSMVSRKRPGRSSVTLMATHSNYSPTSSGAESDNESVPIASSKIEMLAPQRTFTITPPTYESFEWEELAPIPTMVESEEDTGIPQSHEEYLSPRTLKRLGQSSEADEESTATSHASEQEDKTDPGEDLDEEEDKDKPVVKEERRKLRRQSSSRRNKKKIHRRTESEIKGEQQTEEEKKKEKKERKERKREKEKEQQELEKDAEVAETKSMARGQRRKMIVGEILSTEQTYVTSMQLCLDNYLVPLLLHANEIGESPDRIKKLFGNMEVILGFNKKVLSEVEEVVTAWTEGSLIAPIFLRFAPFLKMYTSYSNKFELAMGEYRSMTTKNQKLTTLLNELRDRSDISLGLADLLIMPIQRIPRYSLLLRDLLKNTLESHEDYENLQKAMAIVQEVATHVNEELRRAESQAVVEQFSQKGVSLGSLIVPHRFLVKEGIVRVTVSPTPLQLVTRPDAKPQKEQHQMFLFNDIFVHVKKSEAKNQSDLGLPQYMKPLVLLWISIDSGRKVFVKSSWETISFMDEGGWFENLQATSEKSLEMINTNVSSENRMNTKSVRFGTQLYVGQNGSYTGRFLDGVRSGKGTFHSPGYVYTGYWEDDQRVGLGRIEYSDGSVYEGEWLDDLQHGLGHHTTPGRGKYSGEWVRGVRKGRGVLAYENGDVFHGHWKSDVMEGEGKLVCANGLIYEGHWKHGLRSGTGRLTEPHCVVYEGMFANDLKHGDGKLVYPTGKYYVGEFEEDLRHGDGTLYNADESIIYEGSWELDCPHGTGTLYYPNGAQYRGAFREGLCHGKGAITYENKCCYIGFWEHGQMHGEGSFSSTKGFAYNGQWVHGQMGPKGVASFPNGATYTGHFSRGRFHKSGTYVGGSGDSLSHYEGDWKYGKMNGKGVAKFSDGASFKGQWLNSQMHGDGVYTFPDGSTLNGVARHSTFSGPATFTLTSMDGPRVNFPAGQLVSNQLHLPQVFPITIPSFLPMPQSHSGTELDLIRGLCGGLI